MRAAHLDERGLDNTHLEEVADLHIPPDAQRMLAPW